MSEFVDRCRAEWRRLHVPEAVANEMAADLEADLAEAAAEGSTPEDVLGSSAFDPASFAAAWAAERGVVPPARPGRSRRARVVATIALPAAVAVVGAVLALTAGSGSARVALARPVAARPFLVRPFRVVGPPRLALRRGRVFIAPAFRYAVRVRGGDDGQRTAGITLLAVGLTGLVAAALYWPLRS